MSSSDKQPPLPNILLLMSGSIACAKASALVSAWVKRGHAVQVACTPAVPHFVGHATLEGFSGRPVFSDLFAPGQVMDHVDLARWAGLVVAAPATSNLINKLAAGIADDAPTALWQAAWGRGATMVVVPAMNAHMWSYPATQDSVRKLQSWGVQVLPVADGDLACGEQGAGRMLEPEDILRRIDTLLAPAGARKRVLITGGGTREAIDSVRYIGNHSTGHTAAALADALAARGHAVSWLGAESAMRPRPGVRQRTYISYADLAAGLRELLSGEPFEAVIHAAAVSDFSVQDLEIEGGPQPAGRRKIPSGRGLTLRLQPNPKLLDQLRGWSQNPGMAVIAFKLTHGADAAARAQAVSRLFEQSRADAVVHNDLAEIGPERHPFALHSPGREAVPCAGTEQLAAHIAALLEKLP